MQETQVGSLGQEEPLEKDMATHSSTLAWEIPWTEENDGLYSSWGCKELDMTEYSTPQPISKQHRKRILFTTHKTTGPNKKCARLKFKNNMGLLLRSSGQDCTPNAGGLGSIPGQGTRACMTQLKPGTVK